MRIACDIETKSTGELICIGYYYENSQGQQSGYFTNFDDYFQFLHSLEYPNAYFHYGGGFDFNYLLDYIRNKNYVLTNFLEVGGLIYCFDVDCHKGKNIAFTDSFPLFRCSLDKLSESLVDETKFSNIQELDRSRLEDYHINQVVKYCINDCRLLYKSLNEFENELNMPVQLSAPMQTLKYFKQNFMDKNYQLWRDIKPFNRKMIDTLRSWYFGGHVDVFNRYGENLYEYDIVNCYGYAMREYGAPIGYPTYISYRERNPNYACFYAIKVLENVSIPHTCKKVKIGSYEKLYFLNTRQDLYVTELDLKFFDQYEIKYKVLWGLRFYWAKDFFADYINFWYNKRFTGNKKLAFISKLMINSLYGKFGQNPLRKNSATLITDDEDVFFYDRELKIGKKDKIMTAWYLQPQIAAWITSGARCNLHYFMYECHLNGGNLFYCDTDSLFTDMPMHKDINLRHLFTNNKELGKLELENEIKKGYFLGCKFRGQVLQDNSFQFKAKGFQNANFTEEHFINALNKKFIFENERSFVMKFKSALRTSGDYVAFERMRKTVTHFSLKRRLIEGEKTLPYFLTYENKLM